MLKLYWATRTRAGRPLWLLEELGVPFELVKLDMTKGEHKTPAYKKIHPLGALPALVDGDTAMFESAAICAYLADKFPDRGLAPAPGTPARAAYEQWLFFAMATLEEPVFRVFQHTMLLPEEKRSAATADEARKRFAQLAQVLSDALEGREFLVGEKLSAADVVVGSILTWANFMGLLEGYPRLLEYVGRLAERPAFVRANQV